MTTKYIHNKANSANGRDASKTTTVRTITDTATGNQRGKRMSPSLPTANHVADAANIFFIGSLVVGLISTGLIVWMANVKEGYWDQARQDSEERIALLVTQGDQLRKDTAEANARAVEAQLALEKFKAPRALTAEQQQNVIARIGAWAGLAVSFSVTSEPESIALLQVVRRTLRSAGWIPIASQMGDLEIDGAGVVTTSGIEIQVHPSSAHGTKIAGAANALAQALLAEGIAAAATANPQLKNEDAINVVVGKKP